MTYEVLIKQKKKYHDRKSSKKGYSTRDDKDKKTKNGITHRISLYF